MRMPSVVALPFRDALGLTFLGDGRFRAQLGTAWTVGPKALGSILLVLAARAAQERLLLDRPEAGGVVDPPAVGAEGPPAPERGPVELHTEVLKNGRTASVVAVRMWQGELLALAATVTAGRLPEQDPSWA